MDIGITASSPEARSVGSRLFLVKDAVAELEEMLENASERPELALSITAELNAALRDIEAAWRHLAAHLYPTLVERIRELEGGER